MKKQCKPILFLIINLFLVLNLLCYFGIRSMWSGIIRYTFAPMPYILLLVLTVTALGTTMCSMNRKYPLLLAVWGGMLNVLFLGLDAYIISLTTEATHYFIREFLYGVGYVAGIGAFVFFICYVTKMPWFQKKWVPSIVMIVLFVVGICSSFEINLFNHIQKTPVVYAVGDTYQIVFTTASKGEAWVEIDGVEYNDTFSGYRRTEDTVHKITVPMEVLDEEGSYTVYTRAMFLRGPYCSPQGKTLQETR